MPLAAAIDSSSALCLRTQVRRKWSRVGFYSFIVWDQIAAPECWFQHFINKTGAYTYDDPESHASQSRILLKSKWGNAWNRDVFWSQHLGWVLGPKHVSNP